MEVSNAMNHKRTFISILSILFLAVSMTIVFSMLLSTPAQAQDDPQLYYCMDTANTCAANDFGNLVATVTQVYPGGCIDHDNNPDTPIAVKLDFFVVVQAAIPTRYDVGAILALDGEPVLRDNYEAGGCTRGFLGDPYGLTTVDDRTAWPNDNDEYWDAEENGDLCGDLSREDTAEIYFNGVYVGCIDNYPEPSGDGQIDLDMCLLYDQQADADCVDLLTATPPGSVAKCDCNIITIPVSPTAIHLESLKAGSGSPNTTVIAMAAGLSAVVLFSIGLTLLLRRRALER